MPELGFCDDQDEKVLMLKAEEEEGMQEGKKGEERSVEHRKPFVAREEEKKSNVLVLGE